MDVLDQSIHFDFNKTQLTLLSKLLDHSQLTPITFTLMKTWQNTKTHSHKTFFFTGSYLINQVENDSIQAHQRVFTFLDSNFSKFFKFAQHTPDTFF